MHRLPFHRALPLIALLLFPAWSQAAVGSGDRAPQQAVTLVDGSELAPKALEGRVVLTVFWATWCHICMRELPQFQSLYERHGPSGFEVLALSVDRDIEPVRDYLKEAGLSFHVAMRTEALKSAWGPVQGTPLLFLTSRNGVVRMRHLGALDLAVLEARITELLAQPARGR